MKTFLATITLACIAVIIAPSYASAHVLITDTTNSTGAILHITPDDDPIAGKQSTLYFDVKNSQLGSTESAKIIVADRDGEVIETSSTIEGNLLSTQLTFPSQGVYTIQISTTQNGNPVTFEHTQRVSRGTSTDTLPKNRYKWAEIGIVSSLVVCSGLLILAINNRRSF